MKKTLLRLMLSILLGLIIFGSISLISASGELCRGVNGYYGDCSSDPWRYQGSTGSSSSSSSSATAAYGTFRGGNSEIYQYNAVTRNSKSINYAAYNSPSYPISTGAMPYFTGGTAGYNQYGYDGYGYGGYGYGTGYDDYYGYGNYGYSGYGYGAGYGYGNNAWNYGLGIASMYSPAQAQPWLGVANMVQQFFWI